MSVLELEQAVPQLSRDELEALLSDLPISIIVGGMKRLLQIAGADDLVRSSGRRSRTLTPATVRRYSVSENACAFFKVAIKPIPLDFRRVK